MDEPDLLVDCLRSRRKELNLTMQQVAERAGLSVGFISQIERGITTPSLSSLVAVSRVLGLHVSNFLAQPRVDTPRTRQDFAKYLAEITYMDRQVGQILSDGLTRDG